MTSYTPALILLLLALALLLVWVRHLWMPGRGFHGALPPATPKLQTIESELRRMLNQIAVEIGERNLSRAPAGMKRCTAFIHSELSSAGYRLEYQEFTVEGRATMNVIARLPGSNPDLPPLIVGAHYDTAAFSPGANDNGSAVAVNIYLARALAAFKPSREIRFVFFTNEEPPYFMTEHMGSLRYARQCREANERLLGMICLETIGCFTDQPRSQRYPFPLKFLFPSKGNFLAFVGDTASRPFLNQLILGFRHHTILPTEGIAAPRLIWDVCRSDHYPFWKMGYPAVMVTDTANFRYEHYHEPEDTLDKLHLPAMARVAEGLEGALRELAS